MRPRRSRKRSGTAAASRRPRRNDTGFPSGGSLIDALATLVGGVARITRSAGAPLRILRLGPDQLDLGEPRTQHDAGDRSLLARPAQGGGPHGGRPRARSRPDGPFTAGGRGGSGTATLSFELILRLAGVLARHDPLPFIMRFARTYNPDLWNALEVWGAARLPVQVERERQLHQRLPLPRRSENPVGREVRRGARIHARGPSSSLCVSHLTRRAVEPAENVAFATETGEMKTPRDRGRMGVKRSPQPRPACAHDETRPARDDRVAPSGARGRRAGSPAHAARRRMPRRRRRRPRGRGRDPSRR